jgi:putative transposase
MTPIVCQEIAETGAEIVIPPKRNRKVQRPYDADLYKVRNIIQRFFNRLKQFRRIATRYDKTACQLHELRETRRYRHLAQMTRLK